MNKIVKFYHNFKKKCFRLDLIYKNLQNENYTILIFYRISNISWTRTQICSILFDRWHSRHFQIRHIRNLSCKSSLVQVPARMRGGHSSMSAGHTCSTDTGPLALVALKNTRKRKKIESEIQTFFEVKKMRLIRTCLHWFFKQNQILKINIMSSY